jgi:predicted sulfurtransferase
LNIIALLLMRKSYKKQQVAKKCTLGYQAPTLTSNKPKEVDLANQGRITVDNVKKLLDKGEPILFIDTRNSHDWSESSVKLPGALRIHYSNLEQHLNELPRDHTIVTYCT